MGGSVTEIKSSEQFKEIINSDKPVVIDFWAEWCAPCRMMSPVFTKTASENDHFGFYKVDHDDAALAAVISEQGITALPTFIIYHKGEKVEEMKGAAPQRLNDIIAAATKLTSN